MLVVTSVPNSHFWICMSKHTKRQVNELCFPLFYCNVYHPSLGFFLSKRIFYLEACSLRNLITFYQFSVIMINHSHWKVAIVAKGTIQVLSDSFQSFLAYPTHKNVSSPKKKNHLAPVHTRNAEGDTWTW